jgi:hypothetical protein
MYNVPLLSGFLKIRTIMTAVPTVWTVLPTTKCTNSITHDDWVGCCCIIFHVNLEHVTYDPISVKVIGDFDEYIKPPANAVWSHHASEVHQIYPTMPYQDPKCYGKITECRKQLVLFIEKTILIMVQKRESLLPGVANPAIVSSYLESWKTLTMVYCSCLDGACISWTPKR